MDSFGQISPISELPRRYIELLKQASKTKEPVILFRRNKPVGGLVDYDLLQQLVEYKRQLELKQALAIIKEGEEAYRRKKTRVLKKPAELWKPWPPPKK